MVEVSFFGLFDEFTLESKNIENSVIVCSPLIIQLTCACANDLKLRFLELSKFLSAPPSPPQDIAGHFSIFTI
jgi:hypothetical protein